MFYLIQKILEKRIRRKILNRFNILEKQKYVENIENLEKYEKEKKNLDEYIKEECEKELYLENGAKLVVLKSIKFFFYLLLFFFLNILLSYSCLNSLIMFLSEIALLGVLFYNILDVLHTIHIVEKYEYWYCFIENI